MVGNYLIHNPFNVTYKQNHEFNNKRRFRINTSCQNNLSLYSKS
jgi:hypothetical protein